jgi:hypothetical protein
MKAYIVALILFSISHLPAQAICICFLEGNKVGPHKAKFEIDWLPNPTPLPGQQHRSGECNSQCNPSAPGCHVNAIVTITNNYGVPVVVQWEGQTGGTYIPDGGTGSFATEHVELPCAGERDIEITDGRSVLAAWQVRCNKCSVPAIP